MLLFVNNKPIEICHKNEVIHFDPRHQYAVQDVLIKPIFFSELSGKILIKNADIKHIIDFIQYAQGQKKSEWTEVIFEVLDKKFVKEKIKAQFSLIKAAGGIVYNKQQKALLIKRNGFWDLPKGKAESGENAIETAKREVEEECNVKVKVNHKICTTWHTYEIKGKLVLKRTKWFNMELISDAKMKPQKEEGIEELKWMENEEIDQALQNSFASIVHVIEESRK
jgi:8-oxo-(d)GTP phosphatase